MIFGFVEAGALEAASVDCHRRAGVVRRWDRYVEDEAEMRREEVEGRTTYLQHRAAACEGRAIVTEVVQKEK